MANLQRHYPLYLGNEAVFSQHIHEVVDKYSNLSVTQVSFADAEIVQQAIQLACSAAPAIQAMKPYERQAVLYHCVRAFEDQREHLAQVLCTEAGKPIRDARGEVQRLIDTFRIAAEEAVRIEGSVLNLEITPRAANYHGFVRRFPLVRAVSFHHSTSLLILLLIKSHQPLPLAAPLSLSRQVALRSVLY